MNLPQTDGSLATAISDSSQFFLRSSFCQGIWSHWWKLQEISKLLIVTMAAVWSKLVKHPRISVKPNSPASVWVCLQIISFLAKKTQLSFSGKNTISLGYIAGDMPSPVFSHSLMWHVTTVAKSETTWKKKAAVRSHLATSWFKNPPRQNILIISLVSCVQVLCLFFSRNSIVEPSLSNTFYRFLFQPREGKVRRNISLK